MSVRQFCTYLILLSSPVPTAPDRKAYLQALLAHANNNLLEKEHFLEARAWFDSYEAVPEEDSKPNELFVSTDTNYFDRTTYIKELLFFVHKDDNVSLQPHSHTNF